MLGLMNDGWMLWLILVGLAIGVISSWLLLVRLPRDEEDSTSEQRRHEAEWISRTIERYGGVAPTSLVEEVLDLHQAYMREPHSPRAPYPTDDEPSMTATSPPAGPPQPAQQLPTDPRPPQHQRPSPRQVPPAQWPSAQQPPPVQQPPVQQPPAQPPPAQPPPGPQRPPAGVQTPGVRERPSTIR